MILFLFIAVAIQAQEGMWLLTQIGQLDLKKKGLQIETTDIYNPGKPSLYNAIVQLGGGTASFVSPEGLLLTNHHVAFTALQRTSDVKSDYITDGFMAKTRAEEIQAPGYRARLLTGMKDVTQEVLDAAKGITDPTEKERKIDEKIASMTEAIKGDRKDIDAVVSEMFSGRQYILFTYKVYRDVRIVYAPPLSIGNYGGETDNWMWPRHTGDFSFMRVYMAPDGSGRDYNPENVPYKPAVWLKMSKDPLKDGDLTFVLGYPGFTTRYRSSTSVQWNQEYNYPFVIKNFQEIIDLLDEMTKNDKAGEIKVASLKKGLANTMKNYQGKVDGMKKTHFLDKKLAFEKDFLQWADSDPARKAKYGDLLAREKEQYKLIAATRERDNVAGILQGLGGTPLSVAVQIYAIAKEKEKPESERQPGFDASAISEFKDGMQQNYSGYFEPADKALFIRALKMAAELPADQRITQLSYLLNDKSKTIDQFAADAFKTSKLNDPEYAKSLVDMTSVQLEALNDPFITMAVHLYPLNEEMRKTTQLFSANVTDLRRQYLEALYEWKGTGLYPDANGTMRFTSGVVKGYYPADAVWYFPFTTLKGVVEKDKGVEPFDAPKDLIALFDKHDFGKWADPQLKDVPVAFLHQCDITGGNSGSPVMNAKGELVGLVFDGNYEAMISDWQYDLNLQRVISVDAWYIMFILDKFSHADYILDEMGVSH